jgi:MoxR-like ATPase
VVHADEQPGQHPRAAGHDAPDADALLREITTLAAQWDAPDTSPAQRTTIKDQLRYLHGRTQWLTNEVQRQYVQEPLDALWQKALQEA